MNEQIDNNAYHFRSASIASLTKALSAAQMVMKPALKSKTNPFFKSDYADLESCWDVGRDPLTKNGLAVIQRVDLLADGRVVLETTLSHVSGEWITGRYPINPLKTDPQTLGATVTYARRYAFSALVGIVTEDDDGEAATRGSDKTPDLKPEGTSSASKGGSKAKSAWEEPCTEPQRKRMWALASEAGWSESKLKEYCFTEFHGATSSEQLTKADIQVLFKKLESEAVPFGS